MRHKETMGEVVKLHAGIVVHLADAVQAGSRRAEIGRLNALSNLAAILARLVTETDTSPGAISAAAIAEGQRLVRSVAALDLGPQAMSGDAMVDAERIRSVNAALDAWQTDVVGMLEARNNGGA